MDIPPFLFFVFCILLNSPSQRVPDHHIWSSLKRASLSKCRKACACVAETVYSCICQWDHLFQRLKTFAYFRWIVHLKYRRDMKYCYFEWKNSILRWFRPNLINNYPDDDLFKVDLISFYPISQKSGERFSLIIFVSFGCDEIEIVFVVALLENQVIAMQDLKLVTHHKTFKIRIFLIP